MTFFSTPLKQLGWPLILCLGAALAATLGIAIGGKLSTNSALAVGSNAPKAAAATATPATRPEATNLAAAYLSGRHAEINADAEKAVKFYDRVTGLDPENLNAVQSTYFLATQNGDFAAAVPAARRSYDANPRRGMASVILAVDQIKAGEYAKAFAYLPRSSAQTMNAFALPVMRAWAIAPQRTVENAIDELQGLKNFQETASLVDAVTGQLNEFYGRKPEALAAYDALAARAENKDFLFSMLSAAAEGYHRLGKDDQIKPLFDRFNKVHAASPTVDAYAAIVAKMPVRKVTPAEGMADAMFMSAELLLMNDPNEVRAQIATAYAQAALYLNPDLDIARRFIGSTLAARNHFDESNAILASLKKTSPGYLEVQMQIAENLLRMNKTDEALAALQSVLKDKPTWAEAHVATGDILRQQKKFNESVTAYDNALKYAGNRPENWAIYYSRGISLERNKNWDAAEKDFRKALELRPDDPNILNYLGYSYLDRGVKLGEARRLIENAYRQRPNDGYIIDSFGWALYMNGEYAQAVQSLEKAVESTPADATVNEHLGDVYWKVGRRNEARFQWERALGLEIDEELRVGLRKKLERGLAQK